MPTPRPSVAENPWLWVALFGGVGLLGVIVIGPKFAARWSRVERMQETRERIAAERTRREVLGPAVVNSEAPPVPAPSASGTPQARPAGSYGPCIVLPPAAPAPEREPYVEGDFGPPTSLRYLIVLMMVVMSVGTTGLLITRSRQRRAAELAAAEAMNSSTAANTTSPPAPQA